MRTFTLKGSSDFNAIILSFHSHWADRIAKGEIKAVFRKKGPQKRIPKWMYAYVSTPLSSIVSKLLVTNVEYLSIDDAVAHSKAGLLSETQLREYADKAKGLYVFHVGQVINATAPLTLGILIERFGFWPSANYIPLSDEGVEQLDKLMEGKALRTYDA